MTLSIITINYNNAAGLDATMQSVAKQSSKDFEYVVVDGGSQDGSRQVIEKWADAFGDRLRWISEKDNGIYNAMNKGIRMASGDYLQFLNSGDCLAAKTVTATMLAALKRNSFPSILYGNMVKCFPDGHRVQDRSFDGKEITFLGLYYGTLNHSPAYIKRGLFEQYGLYDESLRIVSDWKWYLQAIILGNEKPVYTDLDVTLFDMTGISETNKDLDRKERRQVLEQLIPHPVLADYDRYGFPLLQVQRLQRHPWAYKAMWLLERGLFKIEKCRSKRQRHYGK